MSVDDMPPVSKKPLFSFVNWLKAVTVFRRKLNEPGQKTIPKKNPSFSQTDHVLARYEELMHRLSQIQKKSSRVHFSRIIETIQTGHSPKFKLRELRQSLTEIKIMMALNTAAQHELELVLKKEPATFDDVHPKIVELQEQNLGRRIVALSLNEMIRKNKKTTQMMKKTEEDLRRGKAPFN